MPYIRSYLRRLLDTKNKFAVAPGDLNYQITKLCVDYCNRRKPHDYTLYNEVMGALECAKQEFYRRMVVPYEDKKIEENGDVY